MEAAAVEAAAMEATVDRVVAWKQQHGSGIWNAAAMAALAMETDDDGLVLSRNSGGVITVIVITRNYTVITTLVFQLRVIRLGCVLHA